METMATEGTNVGSPKCERPARSQIPLGKGKKLQEPRDLSSTVLGKHIPCPIERDAKCHRVLQQE